MSADSFTNVAPYYDDLMSGVPYSMWGDYIEEIFEHLRVKPSRVLDLATGTGSIAIELAERGYQVTGVDLSEQMLEQARRKAAEAGLDIPFLHGDAAELDSAPASFDAVVCLYDSLNYILDPKRLQQAFARIARCLVPGGPFIFDLNTIYSFEQELFTQESLAPSRPVRYRWYSKFDRETRIARVDMEFWTGDGNHFEETHFQRGHSVEEIVDWLEGAGFEVEGIYEAYTLLPGGPKSERLFYVARRETAA